LLEVKTEDVPEFPGSFLVRPADVNTPLPLIIVLGGSEGNDGRGRALAPLLANEGFAALGLPYYSPDRGQGQSIPGLPALFSEIPVDRLEQVRTWAQSDPRVDAERMGLWGNSKGAEFALIAASNYPWIDAVVAIVPSDVVLEGFGSGKVERTGKSSFALRGRPLEFVPTGPTGRGKATKQTGRWAHPSRAAAARIQIERFNGLLLVAGGANDPVLDSSGAAQMIAERRAEAGKPTVSLIFHNAGHNIAGGVLDPIEEARGETPEGTGLARREIWSATVRMFKAAWPR
jgi:poly(3-hydroxybutyrate) depolymerase